MAEQRAEVEAIATDPHAPTLENTLVALERSGQLLTRVSHVFFTLSLGRLDPRAARPRGRGLPAPRRPPRRDHARLPPVRPRAGGARRCRGRRARRARTLRLVERTARRDDPGGRRPRRRRQGAPDRDQPGALDAHDDVRAEPARGHQRLRRARHGRGRARSGSTTARSPPPPVPPPTAGSTAGSSRCRSTPDTRGCRHWPNRDLRERIMRASLARGRRGNEYDNRDVLLRIVRLRAERAELLGFPNHAAVVTADETAEDPRGRRRAAVLPRRRPPPERRRRACGPLAHRRVRRRVVGLGVRDRDPARRAVRRGQHRAPPVLRGRPGPARRGLPRRRRPVRSELHRAPGPARLQRRGPRLRGHRRGRRPRRPVPARPLHAGRQARRRVDEPGRRAVRAARHPARRRQQPQRREARPPAPPPCSSRTRSRRSSTSSATPCTASSPAPPTRGSPARTSSGTSSSSRAR